MKNLTSIAEHSDYLESYYSNPVQKWDLHLRRKEFGKQPLELCMFVPCDEDGNVLELPDWYVHEIEYNLKNGVKHKYQQAKKRCLFEGFEYISETKKYFAFTFGNTSIQMLKTNVIEDLVIYKPLLTATAQKEIGL